MWEELGLKAHAKFRYWLVLALDHAAAQQS